MSKPYNSYPSGLLFLLALAGMVMLLESCDQVLKEDVLPARQKTFELKGARMVAAINQKLSLKDMLANDIISQTATLRIGQPNNGYVVMDTATTTYKYVPPANYTGNDTIPYQVCQDGECDSSKILIEVRDSVASGNECTLQAKGDWTSVGKDSTVRYPVYVNDVVCGRFTIRLDSDPYFGSAFVDQEARIVYTPNRGYIGPDKMQYSICQDGNCSSTWIGIQVGITPADTTTSPDDPTPPATCTTLSLQADTLVATFSQTDSLSKVYIINVLNNDSLCTTACTNITLEISSPPTAGKAVVMDNGLSIRYTAPKLPGTKDAFKYRVCSSCSSSQVCVDAPVYVKIE